MCQKKKRTGGKECQKYLSQESNPRALIFTNITARLVETFGQLVCDGEIDGTTAEGRIKGSSQHLIHEQNHHGETSR